MKVEELKRLLDELDPEVDIFITTNLKEAYSIDDTVLYAPFKACRDDIRGGYIIPSYSHDTVGLIDYDNL